MRGDERARFCQRCQLNVFDVRSLTEAQVLELLAKNGRVCGRLYTRRDGTVLTRDCPTGVRALRLRLVRRVTAALAVFLALVGYRIVTVEKACSVNVEPTLSDRVNLQFIEWREVLRETRTFGPMIERLSPRPRMTMGVIRGSSAP
ncbi:MAG: hypothetical protein QM817_03575 [Archangium sp.]